MKTTPKPAQIIPLDLPTKTGWLQVDKLHPEIRRKRRRVLGPGFVHRLALEYVYALDQLPGWPIRKEAVSKLYS